MKKQTPRTGNPEPQQPRSTRPRQSTSHSGQPPEARTSNTFGHVCFLFSLLGSRVGALEPETTRYSRFFSSAAQLVNYFKSLRSVLRHTQRRIDKAKVHRTERAVSTKTAVTHHDAGQNWATTVPQACQPGLPRGRPQTTPEETSTLSGALYAVWPSAENKFMSKTVQ